MSSLDQARRKTPSRLSRHVLAVLVNPHTEVGVVPLQAMKTRDDIRGHFLQGMADMRRAIGIINSGCNVVTFVALSMFAEHAAPRFFILEFPLINRGNTVPDKKGGRRSVACAPNVRF